MPRTGTENYLLCGSVARSSLVVLLLSLASPSLAADLLGRVTKSGKPMPNVTVTLTNSKDEKLKPKITKTDAAGNFDFSGVAPGKYRLTCDGMTPQVEVDVRAGVTRFDCKY